MIEIDYNDYKQLGNTGEKVIAIGYGTWGVGGFFSPDYTMDEHWIEVIRYAIERGMKLIDTAEMYASGHTEELVGKAIASFQRDELFIVSKVWNTNLRYNDVIKSAKKSLERLKTDYMDLYLIHWPNPRIPLSETMKAMEKLVEDGITRYIGVSNFDVRLMEEARSYLSKVDIVVNQVKYNLIDRWAEKEVLPYCIKEKITLMAYTPLEKGSLAKNKFLKEIGEKYNKTAAQVALNWLISKPNVITIPKTGSKKHVDENIGAMGWRLSEEDVKLLNETKF